MASGPISLVPVALKEAAIDSPTFRGTVLHYAEQVDLIEKWLDGFIKASTKVVNEVLGLEDPINNFLQRAFPGALSESLVDHDYTLLAMRRYAEGSKGFWTNIIMGARKVERVVVDPLVSFQRGELKNFKETRRLLEAAQTKYDSLLARYLSQSKSKEPSSLREDAFQLYEARTAYFKTCFDFCVAAPMFRSGLDRVLTKVVSNQWREQTTLLKESAGIAERCNNDIDRIRSCCDSMETNEAVFRKQLGVARTELERRAKKDYQPARELEEYSISTVPYLTSRPGVAPSLEGEEVASEKQGWLFMRTLTGKPTRSLWVRRWFFVRAGIFGWLVQGYQGGGVEESEKVGVLLCNIKPAFQEERRFCFEVKTKDTTILLQTEAQADLTSWLAVFEQAKRAAVGSSSFVTSSQAFSTIPPTALASSSESAYVTKSHDGNTAGTVATALGEGHSLLSPRHLDLAFERASTLGPGGGGAFSRAASMDVSRGGDATTQPSGNREKYGQKLDLHRKTFSTTGAPLASPVGSGGASVGISALIAASHNVLPFQPDTTKAVFTEPRYKATSLAPNTLVGTPSPVTLLTAAAITSGNGISGIAAVDSASDQKGSRKTVSLDMGGVRGRNVFLGNDEASENFPGYPLELKVQDEHFRILFPGTSDRAVLLVFRAVWSPNNTQELPGRCFVTDQNLYFYAHYLGLVFTSVTALSSVGEVKAAPDKDCDYLIMHLNPQAGEQDAERQLITIKTFLEPLRLLQRRLHFLVKNANHKDTETPKLASRELLQKLIAMEKEVEERGADEESWEDMGLYLDGHNDSGRRRGVAEEFRLRIDEGTGSGRGFDERGKDFARLKLPSAPVIHIPPGMTKRSLEREFDVSPKALFHVMFGERSTVFQTLYAQRRSQPIHQGHWRELDKGKARRQFAYQANFVDIFGRSRRADIVDHQTVEKQEDHLCYVVTDIKTPWHLPHRHDFIMVSKIVITHVAKSKSRLSIWTRVDWFKDPKFSKSMVQRHALDDLDNDALDLGDVVSNTIQKLGRESATNSVVIMFGGVGGQPHLAQYPEASRPAAITSAAGAAPSKFPADSPPIHRVAIKQRTLSQMLLENGLSSAESALSTVIMFTVGFVKAICSVVSTHRILLLLLVGSAVTNVSLSTRSTLSYWTERRANKFLELVEVKPDGIMRRSITLRDLHDVVIAPTLSYNFNFTDQAHLTAEIPAAGLCYRKFRESAFGGSSSSSSSSSSSGGGGGDNGNRKMARRIGSGRERLGMYRHDLVVALRVVNGLERELVRAEWARWVEGERRWCRLARRYVQGKAAATALAEYCGDCRRTWGQHEESGEL